MPIADRGLPSTEEQCLEAVRRELVALKLPDLADKEIQVREEWHVNGEPLRGISICELGETYGPGPVGQHDVGYQIAVVFSLPRQRTAQGSSSVIRAWVGSSRRRFQFQRIPIGDELNGGVIKQFCMVTPGQASKPRGKAFVGWKVRQIIVTFWTRENHDDGE